MDQRLNVLTLGVDDVPRATGFYERLGWAVTFTDGDTWEIAWVSARQRHDDGTVELPS